MKKIVRKIVMLMIVNNDDGIQRKKEKKRDRQRERERKRAREREKRGKIISL